jgi:nucleoside-diphosphate-sugar epimerase
MNANAFTAALDVGVKHIIFASSIQVMIASDTVRAEPHVLPYLPLDGDAPANPGLNAYALSKHFGEELLRTAAAWRPELLVTVVRYPMLVGEWFERRLLAGGGRVPPDFLHLGEGTAHLGFDDAGALVVPVLARTTPGYRQLFPAQPIEVTNLSVPDLVRRFYPGVHCRRPIDEIESLIDTSSLRAELAWRPREPPRVVLVDS